MIAELGQYALVLALVMSLLQGSVPLLGAARNDAAWMAVGPAAALGQLLFTAFSFAALTYLYAVSDFSVLNVVQNSHSAKPMIYKISGVWGNHEGSMLLWVLILALFGAAVAVFGAQLPPTLRARVLAMQGLVGLGFYAFILLTSNPFLRIDPAPGDGQDLNPLLQDIGLAAHPPFLYLGYVGFSMAYCFAMAALLEGRVDAAWGRWVRPWTLAAWAFLTIGIALGSFWAYYELGWGGWWFWDPVENASFMPWLTGTALIHCAVVLEKREALKAWTILLAIITFSFSLLGTFLVRSGVLTSVHAFAVDPDRGLFILALLAIYTGGAFVLYALRAPALAGGGLFAPMSREGSLVLNNLLLTTATATVLLGTLYPLIVELFGVGKISVGPPYFNATFVPIMIPLLAAMGVGPLLAWKRGDLAGALGRLKVAFALTAAVLVATLAVAGYTQIFPALGMALAGWVIASALVEFSDRIRLFRIPAGESWRRARGLPRAAVGMTLAHAGVGIMIAGIVATTAWTTEKVQVMQAGESIDVAGYSFTFEGVQRVQGPNFFEDQARFTVRDGDRIIDVLTPSRRMYPVRNQPTTEAGIRAVWSGNLYASIGDPSVSGGWVTRLWHHPLVTWIWIGSLIMALGGFLAMSDRRHRVGVPSRRRQAAGEPAPAGA